MIRSVFLYAVLLLLPLGVALPTVLQHHIPLDLRLPLTQPPWQDARPAAMETALPAAAMRHAMQTYPWYRFIRSAGEEGFLPLWCPLEGLGYPFLAAWRTRALSPFSIPIYFLPLEQGLWVSVLLKLAVAGVCMQLLGRRLGLDRLSAFCAALAYQWSAGVYGNFDSPASDALAWLPLVLLGLDGVARARPRAWVLAAAASGLVYLGGEPTLMVTVLLLGVAFIAVRSAMHVAKGARLQVFRATGLWLVAGLGVAAVQMLPFIEFEQLGTLDSSTSGRPGAGWLLAFFSPALLPPGLVRNPGEVNLLYAGAPQWMLAALWLAVRDFTNLERRRTVEALIVAGLGLSALGLIVHRLPVAEWGLGAVAPAYLALGIAPAFALATASAMPAWLGLDPDQAKTALNRLLFFMVPLWGGALVAVGFAYVGGTAPRGDLGMLLGCMGILFAVLAVTLLRPRRHLMAVAVAVLTFASLLYGNRPSFQFTPMSLSFPETDVTESLRKLGGRVGGSATLRAWPLSGSALAQTFSTCGIRLKRYEDYMAAAETDPRLLRRAAAQSLLFSRDDIQGEYAELRPHLRIEEVYSSGAVLFRDLEARAEARIAPRVRTVAQYTPGGLDADQPPLFEGSAPAVAEKSATEPAALVRNGNPNEVRVSFEPDSGGILVLADAFYPGWLAESGGELLTITPVDGFFRGVRLRSNLSEVRFSYRPRSLQVGAGVTAISLMLLLVGALWPRPKAKSLWVP